MAKLTSGIYMSGPAWDGFSVEVMQQASRYVKTRTRTLANYLKEKFSSRYEFFPAKDAETVDVIYVGDKLKHRNFEIQVDYAANLVRVYGQIVKSLKQLENLLFGKISFAVSEVPAWANNKKIKLPRMKKKDAKLVKRVAGNVMSFEF